MSQVAGNSFPYAGDPTIPYTDGIISGVNTDTGSVYMPGPGDLARAETPYTMRGVMQEEYMGNTGCVDTNTVAHAVYTGSF